ncbi:MAG: hypothetical protein QUS33_02930 [Dehalococcoidia bacterium]|nr:hypothetical protein [Dehalococcoidia bacterium]
MDSVTVMTTMWPEFAHIVLGPVLAFVGVFVTVLVMHAHHRKDVQQREAHHSQILSQQAALFRRELETRMAERELAVGQTILARSLEALQGAFCWVMQINSLLNEASSVAASEAKTGDEKVDAYSEMHDHLRRARVWYDQNCVYLPRDFRSSFLRLLNLGHHHVTDLSSSRSSSDIYVWSSFQEALDILLKGMETFMARFSLIERAYSDLTGLSVRES